MRNLSQPTPQWFSLWLTFLPPLYILSPASIAFFPYLKHTSSPARWLLSLFAGSQIVPALFSPEPLLNTSLALAKTMLIFGFISVGYILKETEKISVMGAGLAIVYLTAIIYSLSMKADLSIIRLGHPYMTSTTLGLLGCIGVWLSLFAAKPPISRLSLLFLAMFTLIMSGSRSAMLAVIFGLLAGSTIGKIRVATRRTTVVLASVITIVLGILYIGRSMGIDTVSRFMSSELTGRSLIWLNVIDIINSHRWSGVGSYRLGRYLSFPNDRCQWFDGSSDYLPTCPQFLDALAQPWLIAHNAFLQQLVETGPIGLAGLLVILSYATMVALRRSDKLGFTFIVGYLIMNVTDNTFLVPSPVLGEIFWIVIGIQIAHLKSGSLKVGLFILPILFILSLPFVPTLIGMKQPSYVDGYLWNTPSVVKNRTKYNVFTKIKGSKGKYVIALRDCTTTCKTLVSIPHIIHDSNLSTVRLTADLQPASQWDLSLIVVRENGLEGIFSSPMEKRWKVTLNR